MFTVLPVPVNILSDKTTHPWTLVFNLKTPAAARVLLS